MRITKILYVLLLTIVTGCDNGYKYWDISKFKIVDSALKDKEEIKLLYTSRGPDYNKDLDYYIHIVAVSQKTGDTVNILTFTDNGFKQEDKDIVYNFFDENNIVTKLILENPDESKNERDIEALNKAHSKRALKVARDPKFDHIADNDYPTVIGSIRLIPSGN